MAYSEFGTSFAKTFNQWLEDEADRKKEKLEDEADRKKEKRVRKRAKRSKIDLIQDILAGRSQAEGDPLYQVAEQLGAYPEPVAQDVFAQDVIGGMPALPGIAPVAPLPADIGKIPVERGTPLEALKAAAPKGLRKRMEYFKRAEGMERRIAGPAERLEKTLEDERNRLKALEWGRGRRFDELRKKGKLIDDLARESAGKTLTSSQQRNIVRMAAERGLSLAAAKAEVGVEFDENSHLYREYTSGRSIYDGADTVDRFRRNILLMESSVKQGKSPPENPYDKELERNFHDGWNDLYSLAHAKEYEKLHAAERQLVHDFNRDKGLKVNALDKMMEDDKGVAAALTAMKDWWEDAKLAGTLGKSPEAQRGEFLAVELGVPKYIAQFPHQLWTTKGMDEDMIRRIVVRHQSGWFDAVERINERGREAGRPDINFNTTAAGLREKELGLLPAEAKAEAELTGESLKWFDKIGADLGRLEEIPDPRVRSRIKDQIYLLRGEITALNFKKAEASMSAFNAVASSLGKSPDLKFFTVLEPESKATMFSFNQRTGEQEPAPFPVRILVKPGYVMTKAQEEEALDEAYEEAGWARDPLTKSAIHPLGVWIYPPHIDPDYKGR